MRLKIRLIAIALKKYISKFTWTIVVKSVFEEDGKYYSQVFLDKCLYEL